MGNEVVLHMRYSQGWWRKNIRLIRNLLGWLRSLNCVKNM